MEKLSHQRNAGRLLQFRENYRHLTESLAGIGFIWPGSLQHRLLTCGKPRCVCHTDPGRRHGPYWYWTSKREGRTVSRKLSQEEVDIIQPWINNRRAIELTLRQMRQISRRALTLLLHPASQAARRWAEIPDRRPRKRVNEEQGK
jgi:hypothetical protein